MKTYQVTMTTEASFVATVVADSPEEAEQKAADLTPSLCIQCSGYTTMRYSPEGDGGPWEMDLGEFETDKVEEVES